MSIIVTVGQIFSASADVGVSGLAGALGVRIETTATPAVVVLPHTVEGITETPAGSGIYEKDDLVAPLAASAPALNYEVVWDYGGAEAREVLWVLHAEDGLRPTLGEVAALEHTRTNVMGSEHGTFDDDTEPTGTQVEDLITIALGDVRNDVGINIPDNLVPDARSLATVRTAALVESTYFPREIDTERSAYRQYTAQYLDGVEKLSARIPRALRLT